MELIEFQEQYDRYLDISGIKKKRLNIAYGPYDRNILDIYYPEEAKPRYSVIVFIHGGGFFKGDKQRYQLYPALQGVKEGYAVVSINYRLLQEAPFPAALHDAKAAIRYLKANAEQLCIDPSHIAVWGESAGALLATLIGVTQHGELEDLTMGNAETDTAVSLIIDWYAPVDLIYMEDHGKRLMFNETTSVNEMTFRKEGPALKKAMDLSNPVHYLHRNLPAFFIEHGTADEIVPLEISIQFYKQLSAVLKLEKLTMKLLDGAGHRVEDFCKKENLEIVYSFIEKWI